MGFIIKRRAGSLTRLYHGLKKGTAVMRIGWKRRKLFTKAVTRVINNKKELHFSDSVQVLSGGAVHSGEVFCINDQISEGDDYNNRTGRKIIGKYIQCTMDIAPPASNGNFDRYRMCLVYDTQPNQAVPNYTDVFDTLTGSGVAGCEQYKNIRTYHGRFHIVKNLHLPWAVNGGSLEPVTFSFDYNIPSQYSKCAYGSSGVGVPTSGAWLILCAGFIQSQSVLSSTGGCSTRFVYVDDD